MLNEILKLKRAASHFVMLSFFVGAITAILDFTVNQAFIGSQIRGRPLSFTNMQ